MEELLKKQERASGHIVRVIDNLKRLGQANITLGVVEARISGLDAKWEAFNKAHEAIEAAASDDDMKRPYFSQDVYTLTEDNYYLNKGKLLDFARQLQGPREEAATRPPATSGYQMPKIPLPTFAGDFAKWPAFRDLFASMVIDNASLAAIEKLHLLKMSLVDEPAALIEAFPLTAQSLDAAWRTLTNRYENLRLLVTSHVAKICGLAAMSCESSAELKALFNGTVNAVASLRGLGRPVAECGDFLVYLTVQKLDELSRREWENHVGSRKEPSTFAELQTFLETRICTVQALEQVRDATAAAATSSDTSSRSSKTEPKLKEQAKVHQASRSSSAAHKCPVCQHEHYVGTCGSFRAKTADERKEFVLAHKLCLNCLGQHFLRECSSQRLCQTCNAKHHTLLHDACASAAAAPGRTASAGNSEPPAGANVAALSSQCDSASPAPRVLLATAIVNAFTAGGAPVRVRALLDQGSEASLISESLAQRLNLVRSSASITVTGIGGKAALRSRGRVSVTIASRVSAQYELEVGALVLPRLTSYAPPRFVTAAHWPHLDGLALADPDFASDLRVDLLLGADAVARVLVPGLRRGPPDAPVAQDTRLGWILSGRISPPDHADSPCSSFQVSIESPLSSSLQRFWEQEELSSPAPHTEEEERCEAHFVATHTREPTGRYVVRLPLKGAAESLGDSLPAASRALSRMVARASRDSSFADSYDSFLSEYERLGHMELVAPGEPEPQRVFYLPHHGVIRESSETTKFRVVFNGSQKTSLGVSLNDRLHVGPLLLPDLFDVVLRWRRHAVVFSADMEKMYRQVLVHPDDRDLQRILWQKGSGSQRSIYRLRTVTYGLSCAPYLALRVVRQLALDEQKNFPRGCEVLLADVYVDDVLSGADDVASCLVKQRETVELLRAGGFELRKWTSNSPDVLAPLAPSLLAAGTSFSFPTESSFRMLGLAWQAGNDSFVFQLAPLKIPAPLTKRKILSAIASLFDPLGWLAPVVVRAKIFMQALWLLKLDWDDALPPAESREWTALYDNLPRIADVRVPRWMGTLSAPQDIALHGFADASEKAYAAVVYLVVASPSSVSLVAAKTKVAPVKQVSLPRLELCAAQLLARLAKRVHDVLGLNCPVHLWTDSTVTLAWIRDHPVRWATYVANRVAEIQRTLPNAHWRHVGTRENPADCASRGLLASELPEHDLWWNGPRWLSSPPNVWPVQPAHEASDVPERRALSLVATEKLEEPCELLLRYSRLDRLQRIVAWCRRFIAIAKPGRVKSATDKSITATLSPTELSSALSCLVRLEQARFFHAEVAALQAHGTVSKGPLARLYPFIDGDGQLRIGGRLKHSVLDADEKNPIIVARDSPLALLLAEHTHRQTLHGGTQLTLATLRRRFWVLGGRALVKTLVGRCFRCLRFRAARASQLMGALPKERVTPARAFFHTGVDYAGPVLLRTSKGRGHKSTKAYIAVFVCFSTRAVHLEAVSDYSSEAFLAAYKRFTSRRGLCKTLSSDCGTTFVGADSELRALFDAASASSSKIANSLASDGVEWRFNPPAAPHFGGLWEAAVKSVKHHLRRVIGDTTLTFEEMATLLAQIEACLNSRPLCALTDDPEDLDALTPGHFLVGAPLSAVPEPSLTELPASRLSRWQHIQQMRDNFWSRWAAEYLPQLQARPKWRDPQPPLSTGDLVLVTSETVGPTKWPLARIVATHPGSDGHVRVVTVRTATSSFKRPVVKLCPLAKREDLEKNGP